MTDPTPDAAEQERRAEIRVRAQRIAARRAWSLELAGTPMPKAEVVELVEWLVEDMAAHGGKAPFDD